MPAADWEKVICVSYNMKGGMSEQEAISSAEITEFKPKHKDALPVGQKIIENSFGENTPSVMTHYGQGQGTVQYWNDNNYVDGIVYGDQIFTNSRIVVEVVVWIDTVEGRRPILGHRDNVEPATCLAMDEHDKHENDLRQLHHQFNMLPYIHPFNDSTESCDSDQFQ